MFESKSLQRALLSVAAVIALGIATVALTGCGAMAGFAPPKTAAAAPVPAPPAPTPAAGKAVIKASCIGRCHKPNIIDYRASLADAQIFVPVMGQRAHLNSYQQKSVIAYLTR